MKKPKKLIYIYYSLYIYIYIGFPGSSNGKESACNAEDLGLIPGEGRAPGEGNGNPLLCSCLRNPMDRSEAKLGESHLVMSNSLRPHGLYDTIYGILRPEYWSG